MLKKNIHINKPKSLDIIMTEKDIKSLILKYKDGAYHLSKPLYVSESEAIKWLESLSISQFEKLQSIIKQKQGKDFIYILGKRYILKTYDLNIKKVIIKDDEIHVYHKNFLETYLKELLKHYICQRIEALHIIDFMPEVEVQNLKSKYGCCFYKEARVKFATRLIHEPQSIVDSIIVHELAHFYHPNHSQAFYNVVYKYDPYYNQHQVYLKKGGVGDDPIRQ